MIAPNHRAALDAASAGSFHFVALWRGAIEHKRWVNFAL